MEHPGIVKDIKNGHVAVQIESVSACASCQAHSRCGFAESKNKTVEVPAAALHAPLSSFHPGDNVTVHISEEHGLLAVLIAYILPAVVLLAVAVGLSLAGIPEWAVILATLAVLGLYILILYRFRHLLDKKFTLTITPNPDAPAVHNP